ncbi:MAG: fibronectin type III domain-containing protein [Euryarchaeota archaeon]|nr:fibronectin type III domain-containing protein [Euryarchaeota archaeon]
MASQGVVRRTSVRILCAIVIISMIIPLFSGIGSASNSDAPTTPLGVQAVAGNGKVYVNWTEPRYSNASAMSGYNIYRGFSSDNMSLLVTLGNVAEYVDIGLVNGVTYFYSVKGVNLGGEGKGSNITSATPCSVPNRPMDPIVISGNQFLNVTWSAPDFNGGASVIGYNIYRFVSGAWSKIGTVMNQTWFVDSKLQIGISYKYRITAFNSVGEGSASDAAYGIPDVVPGAITELQAFSGVRNVTLTWIAPAGNGGSSIIGYKIYRATDLSMFELVAVLESVVRYVDLGLEDDATYYYRISAFNEIGDGDPSYTVFADTYDEPHVNINAVIPGDRSVTIFWFNQGDGGSLIKRYWVYRGMSNDNLALYTTLGNVLNWTDNDVENGMTYYYSIAAENNVGTGNSQIVNCTPMTVPNPPLSLTGTSWDHYVTLTWDEPVDDGGSEILAYNIYKGSTMDALEFIGTTNLTTFIVAGLEISLEYHYQVSAVNSAGEGDMSNMIKIASGKTPTMPLNLTYHEGNSFVDLSWDVPLDKGTTAVEYYSIYRSNGTGSFIHIADSTRTGYNDTSVVNKQHYSYYVRAHNTIGNSDRSNQVSAYPHLSGTAPEIPINVKAVAGEDHIHISWNAPLDNGGQPITGYIVYRGVTNDTLVYYKKVTDTELNHTGISLGSTFYYKVAAVNAIDQGIFSKIVNATTVKAPEPEKEKKFLWGIFDSLFFYIGLVMLVCGIGMFIIIKKFRGRKLKKKIAKQRVTTKSPLLPQNGQLKKK